MDSKKLTVAVIGAAGNMGKLIAGRIDSTAYQPTSDHNLAEFALHGHTVYMNDLDMAKLEAAKV